VTHEHLDHNGVGVVGGDPAILRSTAGKLDSPVGEVVAVASEHDQAAGTERGPNTIFVFSLEPADAFIEKFGEARRFEEPSFETGGLPVADEPVVVVPAAP
jgi:hypothetical protein